MSCTSGTKRLTLGPYFSKSLTCHRLTTLMGIVKCCLARAAQILTTSAPSLHQSLTFPHLSLADHIDGDRHQLRGQAGACAGSKVGHACRGGVGQLQLLAHPTSGIPVAVQCIIGSVDAQDVSELVEAEAWGTSAGKAFLGLTLELPFSIKGT
eukprot:1114302-Pelagomonas_calceolata.AAC.1